MCELLTICRTMIWAIDLDDGTLIDALGSTLSRNKTRILPEAPFLLPDFEYIFDNEGE